METLACPRCASTRTRRGGWTIWSVYLVLIAATLPMVLVWKLDAALVAAVVLTVVVLAHLVVRERVCLDCGAQWRPE